MVWISNGVWYSEAQPFEIQKNSQILNGLVTMCVNKTHQIGSLLFSLGPCKKVWFHS